MKHPTPIDKLLEENNVYFWRLKRETVDLEDGELRNQFKSALETLVMEAIGEDESVSVLAGKQYDIQELLEELEPIQIKNQLRAKQRAALHTLFKGSK